MVSNEMDFWLNHQPSKAHLLSLVLAAIPIIAIMNFFRKNQFDVAGKVGGCTSRKSRC